MPRGRIERSHPRREHSGEALADGQRVRQRTGATELLGGQHHGQLDEGEGVAVRRGDEAAGDDLVDRSRGPFGQQLVSLRWRQSAEGDRADAREPRQRIRCVADREDGSDAFGAKSASHERQRQRRLVVDPLRVVDDDEHGLRTGSLLGETQHGEADPERVERLVLRVAEHRVDDTPLRFGERVDAVVEQEDELVDRCVPECHLGLDADQVDDTEAGCDVDRVVDQRRLADAGRTTEQERTRGATLGVSEERFDRGPFGGPADQEVTCLRRLSGIVHARHYSADGGSLPEGDTPGWCELILTRSAAGRIATRNGGCSSTASPSMPAPTGSAASIDTAVAAQVRPGAPRASLGESRRSTPSRPLASVGRVPVTTGRSSA